ncbi:MFS transporter [uncultured Endozoicomonas sp.]|uniref:MFS transporter n=1 Tax=uncultured Endozoicomonas sp. TaxID=432652 RepID=UPI002607B179|nr:MFS transporter [uncultured Endozoicomonas sp.]
MENTMRVPRWRLVLYSFGNFGWMLTAFCFMSVINYFYFPPVIDGVEPIPELITRAPVFMGLTLLGLIIALSRLFDAVTDPIIANMSDRSVHKFGRRRIFMAFSLVPFAICSVLIFTPPDTVPTITNAIWVVVFGILAYLFMTMYVMPYTALIPELGKTSADRVFIATANSVAWALAFATGQLIWVIKDVLEASGMDAMTAIRICAGLFAFLGALAMLVPILAIDESKYCEGNTCSEPVFGAMRSAFKNPDFRVFTIANVVTFMATFFLETGAIYYVTMLMGLDEATASLIMIVMFGCSFACYPFVVKLTRKISKRNMQIFAVALHGLLFALLPLCAVLPDAALTGWVLILLLAIPTAINSILPTAIMADIARSDGNRTGSYKEGVFFGAMNFNIKVATSVTSLVFPSLLIIGSSSGAPSTLGVSITAFVGAGFCFIAAIALKFYDEDRVNQHLDDLVEEPVSAKEMTQSIA